jgi:AcrR family transcriptional regulator
MAMSEMRKKRVRRDPDTSRNLILDVTEKLMVEEGYAAVSSRRIANELGLNAATVHYYYPATDDVFIALHERMTHRQVEELKKVLASASPLQAFWEFQSNWGQTALGVEFVALANHRKAIRNKLAGSTDAARAAQAAFLENAFGGLSLEPGILPPVALVTILVAIGRMLANEERVGITRGHDETRAFVDWALANLTRMPPTQ